MARYRCLVVSALCIASLFAGHASARDNGQFANSPLKQWFDKLASGKGLCCSFADGVSVQMSTGTRWMGTIVYEYMGNGSSCLMPRL